MFYYYFSNVGKSSNFQFRFSLCSKRFLAYEEHMKTFSIFDRTRIGASAKRKLRGKGSKIEKVSVCSSYVWKRLLRRLGFTGRVYRTYLPAEQ